MDEFLCPECGKDDQVQKVSSIYSGGVSTTSYQQMVGVQTNEGMIYGNINQTAESRTNLAKRLAPPPAPKPASAGGMFWAIFIGVFMVFTGLMGVITREFTVIIGSIVTFAVCIYYCFGYHIPYKKKYKEELVPEWEKATQKWTGLYYCYRNDCVFDPATGKAELPERISSLEY